MKRIYNFSSGPAVLPVAVLERAQAGILSLEGVGMSVMEMSHRSDHFAEILYAAEQNLRELMSVPDNYKILFIQGGASLQFSMIPLNFLPGGETADFVVTGAWGIKAAAEASKIGNAKVIFSTESGGFRSVPDPAELRFSHDAVYVHYVSNETIDGVEFKYELEAGGIPVVCDASSNILSKPFDIEKYAIIYAGAQKNIGPSGIAIVIIRDDMLDRVPANQHSSLDYRKIADNDSMANTPNTWGIYMIRLVTDWLREQGGVSEIQHKNEQKAKVLYDCIDNSDGFYSGQADRNCRSLMNVTFRLPSPELDDRFCIEAAGNGLDGLKGHRTVGGVRASIYNAFPADGVDALVQFMKDFSARNG